MSDLHLESVLGKGGFGEQAMRLSIAMFRKSHSRIKLCTTWHAAGSCTPGVCCAVGCWTRTLCQLLALCWTPRSVSMQLLASIIMHLSCDLHSTMDSAEHTILGVGALQAPSCADLSVLLLCRRHSVPGHLERRPCSCQGGLTKGSALNALQTQRQ